MGAGDRVAGAPTGCLPLPAARRPLPTNGLPCRRCPAAPRVLSEALKTRSCSFHLKGFRDFPRLWGC